MVGRAGEVGGGRWAREATRIARFQRAAQAGDANAQYALGEWYENGLGRRENPEKAFFWYHLAATQGHAGARRKFEEAYPDPFYRERLAAEEGDPGACYALGMRHEKGDGVARSLEKAFSWYRKAADAGSAEAQAKFEKTYPKAFYRARLAVERGEPGAMYAMGRLYEQGDGVGRNPEIAFYWYRRVLEQGDPDARAKFDETNPDAFYRTRLAAWQGDPAAMYAVGALYEQGEGVRRSGYEAVRWYEKAARLGEAKAAYALGRMQEEASEEAWSLERAFPWYRKAADLGHPDARVKFDEANPDAFYRARLAVEQGKPGAAYALGARYEHGDGVRRDRARAMRWYRRAAKGGDPEAADALGRLHEQNTRWHGLELACRWYKEAAELGHPEALGRYDAVRKRLP